MQKYSELINKIKKQLLENDKLTGSECEKAFSPALSKDIEVISRLDKVFDNLGISYDKNDIENIKTLKLPKEVIEFYKDYNPINLPVLNCGVYLLDIQSILEEVSEREPSVYLIKKGLITIATTIGGNPICIDLNNKKNNIVMCNYDFCSYNDDIGCIEIDNAPDLLMDEFEDEDYIEFKYNNLIRCFIEVAPDFYNFINNIANNKYYNNIEDLLEELE